MLEIPKDLQKSSNICICQGYRIKNCYIKLNFISVSIVIYMVTEIKKKQGHILFRVAGIDFYIITYPKMLDQDFKWHINF